MTAAYAVATFFIGAHAVMSDEPSKIAEQLLETHGDDGAWEIATKGILTAQEDEDNYRLSVWREVRQALRLKRDNAAKQKDEGR